MEKARNHSGFGLFERVGKKSAFAELRSAAGGFEAVLK
jgi:hypothetical protein